MMYVVRRPIRSLIHPAMKVAISQVTAEPVDAEFHHVARGACKTTDLCCVLYLCRACHNLWHRTDGETQRAVCLALLELSRPHHADLERYYQLTHRRFPSRACVAAWRAVLDRETKQ